MSMYLQRNHMISIHVPAKGTTQQVVEVIGQILISIHVPAKGTTSLFRRLHPILIISIHVPAKGTTLTPLKNAFSNQNFNPRSREGNDFNFCTITKTKFISIHVPAKGTTSFCLTISSYVLFQSTFPRRERPIQHLIELRRKNFNPRSREGNDEMQEILERKDTYFNPRSREGNDLNYN